MCASIQSRSSECEWHHPGRNPPLTLQEVRHLFRVAETLAPEAAHQLYRLVVSEVQPLASDAAPFRQALQRALMSRALRLAERELPAPLPADDPRAKAVRMRRRRLSVEACPDCRRAEYSVRRNRLRQCPCGASWYPCAFTYRNFVIPAHDLVRR